MFESRNPAIDWTKDWNYRVAFDSPEGRVICCSRRRVCSAASRAVAQNARLHGVVYADANANGKRDASEPGVSGVIVSNQRDVVVTDSLGRFEIPTGTTGIVFVSVPDGFRSSDAFWRAATPATASVDFGVVRQAHLRTFSLSWG